MESLSGKSIRAPVRGSYFVVGWLGVLGGIVVFFAGLVSRHIDRLRRFGNLDISNDSFDKVWSTFAVTGSDTSAFISAIGRIVYFVSAVAALFTYRGPQFWTWGIVATGGLLLIGSAMGSLLKEKGVYVSLGLSIAGGVVTSTGIVLAKIYPRNILSKIFMISAIAIGCSAFPAGIYTVTQGGSFRVCIIVECIACIVALIGLGIGLQQIATASAKKDDAPDEIVTGDISTIKY